VAFDQGDRGDCAVRAWCSSDISWSRGRLSLQAVDLGVDTIDLLAQVIAGLAQFSRSGRRGLDRSFDQGSGSLTLSIRPSGQIDRPRVPQSIQPRLDTRNIGLDTCNVSLQSRKVCAHLGAIGLAHAHVTLHALDLLTQKMKSIGSSAMVRDYQIQ
jgi:hypothetical protein